MVTQQSQNNPYLKSLKKVAGLGVDLPTIRNKTPKQKISAYDIDENFFYENLYADRSQQDIILDQFLTSRDLIVLLGPQRSGKTCILKFIVREIQKRRQFNTFAEHLS